MGFWGHAINPLLLSARGPSIGLMQYFYVGHTCWHYFLACVCVLNRNYSSLKFEKSIDQAEICCSFIYLLEYVIQSAILILALIIIFKKKKEKDLEMRKNWMVLISAKSLIKLLFFICSFGAILLVVVHLLVIMILGP
jgi:hypothetical protein